MHFIIEDPLPVVGIDDHEAESSPRTSPMNRLAAILPASNVLVDVDATSKKRAFEHAGLVFQKQLDG